MKPWPFVLTTSGFAELESRAQPRTNFSGLRADNHTDFSGLERVAAQNEARAAWGERQHAELDEEYPCTPAEDGAMLIGVGVFVFLALAFVYMFGPAVLFFISKVLP